MGFLRGHIDLYRQVELRAIYPFISIRNSDEGIKITIKSDKSYKRIIANTDMVGNTTITLDKVSRACSKSGSGR
jgi:hypothetical protein